MRIAEITSIEPQMLKAGTERGRPGTEATDPIGIESRYKDYF